MGTSDMASSAASRQESGTAIGSTTTATRPAARGATPAQVLPSPTQLDRIPHTPLPHADPLRMAQHDEGAADEHEDEGEVDHRHGHGETMIER